MSIAVKRNAVAIVYDSNMESSYPYKYDLQTAGELTEAFSGKMSLLEACSRMSSLTGHNKDDSFKRYITKKFKNFNEYSDTNKLLSDDAA